MQRRQRPRALPSTIVAMGGLFSSSHHAADDKAKRRKPADNSHLITDADRAVLKMKQQRDKLKEFQKKVGVVVTTPQAAVRQWWILESVGTVLGLAAICLLFAVAATQLPNVSPCA